MEEKANQTGEIVMAATLRRPVVHRDREPPALHFESRDCSRMSSGLNLHAMFSPSVDALLFSEMN